MFSNRKSAGHFQAFLITSFPLIFLTRWTKPVLEEDKFLLELCFRLFLCVSVSLALKCPVNFIFDLESDFRL